MTALRLLSLIYIKYLPGEIWLLCGVTQVLLFSIFRKHSLVRSADTAELSVEPNTTQHRDMGQSASLTNAEHLFFLFCLSK